MNRGIFTISLDFELYWGMRDHKTLDSYRDNLLGERRAVPAILETFRKYGLHATWATVGFLFFENKRELLACVPELQPTYRNPDLNPYPYISQIGENEREDGYHYAASLIHAIRALPHQELGTHTFSHYYCLEPGQSVDSFREDLACAIRTASRNGIKLRSLVFPRNQFNESYVEVCKSLGLHCYRGNQNSWVYEPRNETQESRFRRAIRLMDSYINLTGHHAHDLREVSKRFPYDIPASRFLRPYSPRLRIFEPARFRRIKDDLTYAAKNRRLYHLWWHPHNFGVNLERNIGFLEDIVAHYRELRDRFGMENLNMGEISDRLGKISGRKTS